MGGGGGQWGGGEGEGGEGGSWGEGFHLLHCKPNLHGLPMNLQWC